MLSVLAALKARQQKSPGKSWLESDILVSGVYCLPTFRPLWKPYETLDSW
jgi:hypothetical protein